MSIVQALIGSISGSTSGGGGGGGGYNGTPSPGGGSYQNFWPGSEGWGVQGGAYDPGGGISSVTNPQGGWRRTTAIGNWSFSGGNDDPSIFNSAGEGSYDFYGGFGTTVLSDNYCCEWKGYLRAQFSATFNFLLDSDDVAMFWIGDSALNPDSYAPHCATNNGNQLNPNSVSLTGGLWYPVRMRYQEWSGAERCQLYFQVAQSPAPMYAMVQWQNDMAWNGDTLGY